MSRSTDNFTGRFSRPSSTPRPKRQGPWLLATLLLSLGAGPALAQADEVPLAELLPDTTVFAVFAQPGSAFTTLLEDLAAELELDQAGETIRKLGAVLGFAADEAFDLPGAGPEGSESGSEGSSSVSDGFGEMLDDLAADCPALAEALDGAEPEALMGPAAAGVSASSFNPVPAVMAVVRPADAELAERLFVATTGCYDSGVAMSEGATPPYVLGDGGDFPVVVARLGGTLLAATDPDVVRGMVRRANGADEPSHLDTRIGRLASSLTSRGWAVSLDLAGLANTLGAFTPMLGTDPDETRLIDRLLATLRVINGVAASVAFDGAGLVVDSVVTVDRAAAAAAGEETLLDLLGCAGCTAAAPDLIPADPASLSRASLSLPALVAWLDGWLLDAAPLLGEELSVAGLVDQYLGVDLNAALLDWLGTTWHTARLGVYDTDAAAWLQGPGTVTVVPVSSEGEAREGVRLWAVALENASGIFAALLEEAQPETEFELPSTVSVREITHRGITYQRIRTGLTSDLGVAVIGGHLVTSRPARTIEAVIDVHLGGASVVDDPIFGRLLTSQPPAPASYRIVDLPRYLSGLAAVSDLAAGPVATTLMLAVQSALSEGQAAEGQGGTSGPAPAFDPADVPTFDELIGLADLVTEALELLAARSGVALGSTEVIDGVRWSTLRVPLR